MRIVLKESKFNPNPITKLFSSVLVSFTVLHPIGLYAFWGLVLFISLMYFLNDEMKYAIKNIVWYGFLFIFPGFEFLEKLPMFIKILLSIFFVMKMFYPAFMIAKFFITTSDVGSIMTSMDKLKIPNVISIPIAVMFRFFPAFSEERASIRLAMKIRGITLKNPIKYLEYVAVPSLIISSNIAEDIAKAAETRCIESKLKKERYKRTYFGIIDIIFVIVVFSLVIGGWIWFI
ncbi:MAG: energy-coupling factor transporter transmembrane component T [Catonella sp.]|uniref:energy-coupling factor transporter transmembrane component T n=1 Tax=Catonella sp. TaxID=2382125 RepID=UPI003FA095E7